MLIDEILTEDLGNLASLNLGPLIGLLKTSNRDYNRGGWGPGTRGLGTRFTSGTLIGPNSPIIDTGVLKDPFKQIKKLFNDNDAKAVAVYIGNQAVLFAQAGAYSLAGPTRSNMVSWDLTPYREKLGDRWGTPRATSLGTEKNYKDVVTKVVRDELRTADLKFLMDTIKEIAAEVKQPVTAKLVMPDRAAIEKRQARYSPRDVWAGAKDLKTRLAIYKNSKKPTVNTIEEFIQYSLANQGKKVRFANSTYVCKPENYTAAINPSDLLAGKPFTVSYRNAEPNTYDNVNIEFAYDYQSNGLIPMLAKWTDFTGDKKISRELILDLPMYVKKTAKIDYLDKAAVIPRLLQKLKSGAVPGVKRWLEGYEKAGIDWPELDTIRKSLAASELEKAQQQI